MLTERNQRLTDGDNACQDYENDIAASGETQTVRHTLDVLRVRLGTPNDKFHCVLLNYKQLGSTAQLVGPDDRVSPNNGVRPNDGVGS